MDPIHQAIAAGERYQLGATATLAGNLSGLPLGLFRALHRAQPGGCGAFINTGDEQVPSVFPELFSHWDGEQILSRPMKSTGPRGATTAAKVPGEWQEWRNKRAFWSVPVRSLNCWKRWPWSTASGVS